MAKDWRTSHKWTEIIGISLDDCVHARGKMERLSIDEIFGRKTGTSGIMSFGKHKGQPLEWVRDNDPGYWEWAKENIAGFKQTIKGL